MATDILDSLLERAIDATKKMVDENLGQPIGDPETVLNALIERDKAFSSLWEEWLYVNEWKKKVPADNPKLKVLLDTIKDVHDESICNDVQRIGRIIQELRLDAGLSIRALARISDVPNPTILRLEKGTQNATIEIVSKILRPFGKRLTVE